MPKKKEKVKKAIKKKAVNNNSYTAEDITVLKGLEPVRKRPGMYIGSTGPDGLHHLIYEVVDNSIDEAMAGFAKNIEVIILDGKTISVKDDGRGIPVETHKDTKKSALETVLTMLHAGGKFGGRSYKVSGGLHGVGVSVVNALSVKLRAEVCREGTLYFQEYTRGKVLGPVKKNGKCQQNGTTITFEPDPEVFKEIKFEAKRILSYLRDLAYLTKGTKIKLIDKRDKLERTYAFYFDGGIVSFISHLAQDENVLQRNLFYVSKEYEGMLVEIGLIYVDSNSTQELAFANNIRNSEGGMHLTGFRSALTRVLNDYARSQEYLKEKDENLTGDDVREGLIAVVSVKLHEPQFEGQTKAKLGNPEARTSVETVMGEAFREFLEVHKDDARLILQKCLLTQQARRAARAAKDSVLRKGAFEGFTLPGKLADCSSKSPEESELFIVEGDSAGGSAKQGRDRHFQAILPLRGKILNVEKARIDKILTSKEIKDLIVALGAGIGEDFKLENLRYHKVVIMTDADVDGAHIRTLLLTLFYRYLKPMIEKGYVYIAQPPLYKIKKGKDVFYAYSEEEKEKIIKEISKIGGVKKVAKAEIEKVAKGKIKVVEPESADTQVLAGEEPVSDGEKVKGMDIQRYKGLGEMRAEELWETTMDPLRRILKRVTIQDAQEADKLFNILMGEVVEPRKDFIQSYAKSVKNLDV